MRHIYAFIWLILFTCFWAVGEEKPISIKLYGYISYEMLYDTYRSLDSRDGELYFYPLKPNFDENGNDINKRSKFNMLAVQSRFGFTVSGPDLFGAKAGGRIEADFFGTHQDYVRLLRLRRAFVTLTWDNTQLLMGNEFHPFFNLDCFPVTVSFAAAVPFHPLNRSPQVRIRQNLGHGFTASAAVLVHGYHKAVGPGDQQRNSGLPESQVQLRFEPNSSLLLGAGGGYKFLSPRDVTEGGLATDKNVGSYRLQGFTKITTNIATIKLQGIYGENMTSFVMIGGYGAKGYDTEEKPFDWNSDYDYTNLKTLSLWGDVFTRFPTYNIGLFVAYTEQLGSDDPFLTVPGMNLTRAINLDNLLRISPRIEYTQNNLTLAFEYAWYRAIYGEEIDDFGKPAKLMDAAINNHFVFQAKYTF